MSNQYKNALQEAASELADDLNRYGIVVDGEERMIVWRGVVKGIHFGTDKRECRRILKRFIASAQEAHLKETQEALL